MLPNLGEFIGRSAHSGRPGGEIAAALLADLTQQRELYGLRPPDLIMLPAGLAVTASRAEYGAAVTFLGQIRAALGLAPERIVLAPGTGDISGPLYGRYLRECQTASREPAPPYWPKWKPFAEALGELYRGTGRQAPFTDGQPWEWREDPAARTAVAVVNSTVFDTGQLDRLGRLGADQLAFFAASAAARSAEGWLCVAIMYDSPLTRTDGAIADGEAFAARVAAHLNVIVHAQPRPAAERISLLGPALVLAAPDVRPGGYQILSLGPPSDRVFGRVYDPERDRWRGDLALGEDLRVWWRSLPVRERA